VYGNPGAERNLIREDKIHQIYSSMQSGQEKYGMQTFNQSLANAYFQKQIALETAMTRSSNQDELQEMISRGATFVNRGGVTTPAPKNAAPVKR
jgi:twitching motility protein PilT